MELGLNNGRLHILDSCYIKHVFPCILPVLVTYMSPAHTLLKIGCSSNKPQFAAHFVGVITTLAQIKSILEKAITSDSLHLQHPSNRVTTSYTGC